MDFVDQVTLDFLLNKEMYNDHVQNKKIAKINKEERKFYKKRIFQLFKDIVTGSEPEDLPMDIKYAYNNFLNACIHHFKVTDSNNVIQSEFKDFIFKEENEVIEDVSLNQINQSENNLEADKILILSPSAFEKPTFKKSTFKKGGAKSNSTFEKSTFDKGAAKSKSEVANFMFTKIETKDK
jgi:hypothetical protein